jgi:hypothetical protein
MARERHVDASPATPGVGAPEGTTMIVNRKYTFAPRAVAARGGVAEVVKDAVGGEPLRWFVSAANPSAIEVEVTECVGLPPAPIAPVPSPPPTGRAVVVSLVPTGIGCTFGGYAGDAAPVTALLGAAADLVVTNPNAVNASNFIFADDRVVYTEGYSLNLFATGVVPLYRPRSNRIGVIIERAVDEFLDEVFNIVNAARAVYGLDIVDCLVTDEPVGTRCVRSESGAYGGRIEHPEVLLSAGQRLVDAGATALAVTTNVRGLPAADYSRHFVGTHPNPVGGAEAVVSHLLTRTLGVPSAHAPMINFKDVEPGTGVVDARAAAEFVSTSGLACVLIGLRRAPQLQPSARRGISEPIVVADVVAVVAPATALGSGPVLSAVERGTTVIAVRENETILNVTAEVVGLGSVIEVDSYLAASGLVLALRNWISIESLRRPLATLNGGRTHADRPGMVPQLAGAGSPSWSRPGGD